MGEQDKEGIAYKWCPICGDEWEEALPWKDRTIRCFEICEKCLEQGHTHEELTPEFWDDFMLKTIQSRLK